MISKVLFGTMIAIVVVYFIILFLCAITVVRGDVVPSTLNINTMELHDYATCNVNNLGGKDTYVCILKVHKGWIYYKNYNSENGVFVPEN